jgi:FlaG/FlaF family flagellin (archaellin)
MHRPALIGAVLLVAVGVVLGTTVFRTEIAQATGLAQSVTIDNTAANPVPVREQNLDAGRIRVHEAGTANVDVTNSSLNVNGTVAIDQSANGVHEVNGVASSPFTRTAFASFGSGNPGAFNAEVDLYTVPPDQRVVVTYAAATVNIPAGEHAVLSILSGVFGSTRGVLPLTDQGSFAISGPTELLTGGGLVNIVYEPGEHIVVHAFRSTGVGNDIGQLVASVTGFTVEI